MKELHVTFSDGSVWAIEARIVAEHRANLIALSDARKEQEAQNFPFPYASTYRKIFHAEYASTIDSPEDLIDWAKNNMTWEEVHTQARILQSPQLGSYKDEWTNAHMEIKESGPTQ